MRGLSQIRWGGLVGLSLALLSGCSQMANSEVTGRVSKEATVIGATAAKTAADLKAASAKQPAGTQPNLLKADP